MRTLSILLLMSLSTVALADESEVSGSARDSSAQGESAQGLSTPSRAVDRVAARVQAFYDRTGSLEASFTQSYWHALHRTTQRASGTMALDRPGRIRFDYANGKVVASGGRYVTVYEPGDDAEPGQYVKTRTSEESMSSAFGFIMGTARIDEDYTTRLLDAGRYRWSGDVLELRPRTADARVARVLLYVDSRPGREGVVHRLRIDDHDGNRNTLTLRSMRFNRDLGPDRFVFQPPAGSIRM